MQFPFEYHDIEEIRIIPGAGRNLTSPIPKLGGLGRGHRVWRTRSILIYTSFDRYCDQRNRVIYIYMHKHLFDQ
jgi:hypothetical protein